MRGWAVVVLAVVGMSGQALAQGSEEAAGAAASEVAKPVPRAKPKIVQIAVPAFKEVGPGAKGWGTKAAELWAAKLAEAAKVKTLGPAALSQLLNERQLAALSSKRKGDSVRVAKVQAILTGEILDQTDRLVVNCRLVSAYTGAVWVASKQSFEPSAAPPEPQPVAAAPEPKPEPAPVASAAAEPAQPQPQPEAKAVTSKVEPASEASEGPEAKAATEKDRPVAVAEESGSVSRAGGVESGSVEVAVRKLADQIAQAFAQMPGNARYRRLAVIPFNEIGKNAKSHQIGSIVTAEVATNLRRDHGLLLVERAQLADVMDELQLKELTQDNTEQAGEVGKLSDAQALVIGSVADVGDKYLVNARVVSASTGQTLAAESVSLPAAGLVSMASESVVLRSRSGAVFRSLIVPGWGQIYNRQSLKAGLFMGGELALLGGALAFQLTGNWALGRYQENTPETAGHWKLAEERYGWRNILLYVAAGVWVVNIIDAYLSGVDGDSALSGAMGQREPRFVPVVSAGQDGAMVGGVLTF